MLTYKCKYCGYIYDPAVGDPGGGIKPGTKIEDLPINWNCPICREKKYVCSECGYIYDPYEGDPGGGITTIFMHIPGDWVCPICGADKSQFELID